MAFGERGQHLLFAFRQGVHLRRATRGLGFGAGVVYDASYRDAVATIRGYLGTLGNLQQVGRNGQHRYNNQDHSMLTAMLAVRNLLGEQHDIWAVNTDAEYHETMERVQPRRLSRAPVSRDAEPGAPAACP